MSLIQVILMVVGIVAALIGMKQQKNGAAWGQPLALIGAILAIVCALWSSFKSVTQGNSAASDRELRYQDLQHRYLGDYIKQAVPDMKKIGFLVDSYYLYDEFGEKLAEPRENKQMDSIRNAVGCDFACTSVVPKKVDKSKLPKDANGNVIAGAMMMDPMNSSFNSRNIDKCLEDLKDCDVIVVLGAMDATFNYVALQKRPAMKGKKLAANTSGNYNALNAAFAAGTKNGGEMLAVSCSKASAIYDDKIPSNDQKAYDRRYILITKENYTTAIKEAQAGAGK